MADQSDGRKPRGWFRAWVLPFCGLALLYGLSAIPMIYWHDSGTMPNAIQPIVKKFYGPLHLIIILTTGRGNG